MAWTTPQLLILAATCIAHASAFSPLFGASSRLPISGTRNHRTSSSRGPTNGILGVRAQGGYASDLLPFIYLADADLEEETPRPSSRPSRPSPLAPMIILFDERRGCSRESNEYTGKMTGTNDDKMCIKVYMDQVVWTKVRSFFPAISFDTIKFLY
jgi:hypothetical protein